MSYAELKRDQDSTFKALLRLVEADRTESVAFQKTIERLGYINVEMVRRGFISPETIR